MKAFPNGIFTDDKGKIIGGQDGMDLRDYFAAKAMQGLLADHSVRANIMRIADEEDASEEEVLAELSYRTADAMMKVRNERV
jgi:hypothetical protein